jgi:hypothetical protein
MLLSLTKAAVPPGPAAYMFQMTCGILLLVSTAAPIGRRNWHSALPDVTIMVVFSRHRFAALAPECFGAVQRVEVAVQVFLAAELVRTRSHPTSKPGSSTGGMSGGNWSWSTGAER